MSDIAPGQLLKERYIPLDTVQEVCGVSQEYVQNLIDKHLIRYAEFTKPGEYKRVPHVDPVEIKNYLAKRRRDIFGR